LKFLGEQFGCRTGNQYAVKGSNLTDCCYDGKGWIVM